MAMKLLTKYALLFHLLGGILFISQPVWLSTAPPEEAFHLLSRPTIRDFIANTLLLAFFYLHFYWLIPRLYFQQRHYTYIAGIIAGFLAVMLLPSLLTGRNPFERAPLRALAPPMHDAPPGAVTVFRPSGSTFFEEIKHHIFLFASVVLFSLLLRVRGRWYRAETLRQQAELDSLKAQINPHFLFNTLNSIYALAVKKDDHTPDAIINLSELMRYIIKDAKGEAIPVHKELTYIRNYIGLQQSRLGDTVVIDCTITEAETAGKQIAPLLLISFIENAFKYGVNPDKESLISIAIEAMDSRVKMEVRNSKVAADRTNNSSGIGMVNASARLQLLYPNRHRLTVSEDALYYQVNLIIELL